MRSFGAFLIAGICLVAGTKAESAVLSISPTRLLVTPETDAVAFKLRNDGAEEALVEIAVHEWTDVNDPNALEPTRDFLVVPPVVEVPASETQVLRLAPRYSGEIKKEKMYRLIIKEVSSTLGPQNGIGFALELNLPVFLAPNGASPQPIWSIRWKDVATPELALMNQGDAHVRVRSFELLSEAGKNRLFASDEGAYVLPGEEKAWSLDASLASLKGPVVIKVQTTAGPIETRIPMPEG